VKPFEAHLRDCRTLLTARPPVRVPTLQAPGLVLGEEIRAAVPFPAFVASAMDGYAVRAADLPGRLRVVGDIPAGRVPDRDVGPGTAVRIMTGSAVPNGADAVVPVEEVTVDGDHVEVAGSVEVGRHIRGVGEDVQPGDLVLPAGQLIGAAQVAALAAHNVAEVAVHPRHRVAVISTGDELVGFGSPPGPVQLVDSNGPGLAAAASAAGAEVVHVAHCGDDPQQFLAAVDRLTDVDLLVTSGGVSMGAYDVVKAALSGRGVRFEAVAMQPGKPQAWGRLDGGVGFLGLPGNPVSALVSFELFGRAALGRERPRVAARLCEPVNRSPVGKRQFLRGRLGDDGVHVIGGHESHLVVGLARANCLVVVPEDRDSVGTGELVQLIPLVD
jgi:molybdopterin molybdotransferase